LDNQNDSEDDEAGGNESDIELGYSVEDTKISKQWDVSVAPNVPRLIQPIPRSKMQGEQVLMTVHTMETRRNKGIKKK